jgi:hypothetical protein
MNISSIRFVVDKVGDFHVYQDGTIWFDCNESLVRDMYVWDIIDSELIGMYTKFVNMTENCQFDLSLEDFVSIMRKLKTAYELMD